MDTGNNTLSKEIIEKLRSDVYAICKTDIETNTLEQRLIPDFGVRTRNNQIFLNPPKFNESVPLFLDCENEPLTNSFELKPVDKLDYEWMKRTFQNYLYFPSRCQSWVWVNSLMKTKMSYECLRDDLDNITFDINSVIHWHKAMIYRAVHIVKESGIDKVQFGDNKMNTAYGSCMLSLDSFSDILNGCFDDGSPWKQVLHEFELDFTNNLKITNHVTELDPDVQRYSRSDVTLNTPWLRRKSLKERK